MEFSVSGRAALTAGYLPVAAFRHLDPTLVGHIELGQPLALQVADPGRQPAGERDALALVRLHGEPLGVVHLDRAQFDDDAALAARIWQELAGEITAHCARSGCVAAPATASDLTSAALGVAGCPSAVAHVPAGTVSMIVPTGGRADKLPRCLRSLAALDHPGVELMVVDNRPDDPATKAAVDALCAEGLDIKYVAERRPGSSVARNRGMAESTADFVAFTDDDVVVDPSYLRWLLAPFSDPIVNVVTGMVLPLELDTAAQKRFEQYAGFSKGVRRARYDLAAHRADDRVMYPYWGGVFGSGNSMAFRRAELVAAGGLDPALGAGSRALAGSDIEAFSSAILRGGQLVYEPRSVCWHEHRRDDAALERQIFNYGVGLSAIFTKALIHDTRRFVMSFVRSVPIALRLRRQRRALPPAAQEAQLPAELGKLNMRGLLRGPKLYVVSVRWARRLRLGDVILGR